jgi:hypothetical protein
VDKPEEEVPEVDELAMALVLDIDNTPAVLATANGLTVDNDGAVRADNSKGNHALNALVQLDFLIVELLRIEGIEADAVVVELGADLEMAIKEGNCFKSLSCKPCF